MHLIIPDISLKKQYILLYLLISLSTFSKAQNTIKYQLIKHLNKNKLINGNLKKRNKCAEFNTYCSYVGFWKFQSDGYTEHKNLLLSRDYFKSPKFNLNAYFVIAFSDKLIKDNLYTIQFHFKLNDTSVIKYGFLNNFEFKDQYDTSLFSNYQINIDTISNKKTILFRANGDEKFMFFNIYYYRKWFYFDNQSITKIKCINSSRFDFKNSKTIMKEVKDMHARHVFETSSQNPEKTIRR